MTSRNRREGFFLGKLKGEYFRTKYKDVVGAELQLFAAWCYKNYGWRKPSKDQLFGAQVTISAIAELESGQGKRFGNIADLINDLNKN